MNKRKGELMRRLQAKVLLHATVLVTAAAAAPSLRAHSFLPTHVVAAGGKRAVIWSSGSKSVGVYSLADGSFLYELRPGNAKPIHVLYNESRKEFWGTGIGEVAGLSSIWQWQISRPRPTVALIPSATRIWSAHQYGGRRYIVYTEAGTGQITLGEIDSKLNVIQTKNLPDPVAGPDDCVVTGAAAPADGARYWIDFTAGGGVHACKEVAAKCDLHALLQVSTGSGRILLCEQACNIWYLRMDDGELVRQSGIPIPAVLPTEIYKVFVDPWRDRAIYALAGIRADSPDNLELWKSTDEGTSWRRIELEGIRPIDVLFTEAAVLVENAHLTTAETAAAKLTVLDHHGAPRRTLRLRTEQQTGRKKK